MSDKSDTEGGDALEELDVVVNDLGEAPGTDLLVQVVSFDGGPEKVRIGRIATAGKKAGKFKPVKRLLVADFVAVARHVIANLDPEEE